MKRVVALFLLIFLPLLVVPEPSEAEEHFSPIGKAYHATYILYSDVQGLWGSAWILDTGKTRGTVVVTAAHCILNKKTGELITKNWWIWHPGWPKETKFRLKVNILGHDVKKDVAILSSPIYYNLPGLQLAKEPPLHCEEVAYVANGGGLIPHTKEIGNYLATKHMKIPKVNPYPRDYDLFIARVMPGSSGSPMLNRNGHVISMAVGYESFQGNPQNTQICLANPLWYIKETLQKYKIRF